MMLSGFRWTTFDLTSSLSGDWQQEIAATAADADFREFPRTPILSREGRDVKRIYRGRVHAAEVRQNLPWLYGLYRGHFSTWRRKSQMNPSWPPATTATASCSTSSAGPRCGSSATSTPTR